jgi:hypothetical protein
VPVLAVLVLAVF